MTLQVALRHQSRYRYDRPVRLGAQTIRLRPAPHCRTGIESYSLRIEPPDHFLNWQQDPHGNFQARVVVPDPIESFTVTVDLVAEMSVINPFDFFIEESASSFPFAYEPAVAEELEPFLAVEPPGAHLAKWLATAPTRDESTIDFLVELNQRLENDIHYVVRLEPGVQTPEETLESARGSCRDSAWLLVQILRHRGIAARFASGYLIQLEPDVAALDGPSGAESDFTDLHAWAEAYVPGAGWIGLDPTSGLLAGEGHIPLACTPKPQSAAPIAGELEPCEVTFEHEMSVERVAESPRVTKPYTNEAWEEIFALGLDVDRQLEDSDVRLTMGGEPTFVSIDDVDEPEWNTEAVGPTKQQLAADLAERLRRRFAPGSLLHFGQGKWYPGEPLPRWAFSIYWREDEVPLWNDSSLIALRDDRQTEATPDQAQALARGIAERLALDPDAVMPAFEDPIALLQTESAAPPNIDVTSFDVDDGTERVRLTRALSRGVTRPAAFVLPVQAWNARAARTGWRSELWSLRRDRLYLAPGDSPAGYRLPIESLPALDPADYPHIHPQDPTIERPALPKPKARAQRSIPSAGVDAPPRDESGDARNRDGAVRTALVAEPRDGQLCVFLPPVETAEAFTELVGVIEDTAQELDTPVRIEGYAPPTDARLQVLRVTPDPGVIEVNVQPASSWRALVENTSTLYEEARQARLTTEKFQLDGQHTGTGGGNHVVVGGRTPNDSPFLRRPHLLRSLVGYWLNHPSLSYLFSGRFIGPTSQAPRIDEARHESIYELEIAFSQIPEGDEPCPPWLVDRVFRNLLVDVSGNTHRAEICIDKLYSPDTATGRLGLVEFRGFEMPPHPQMSLVQQLLIRALIARFWDEPFRVPPVRWGTTLHDRFMLPHFVWSDFGDVLADLSRSGFHFDPGWFEVHHDFRFPRYGSFRFGDVEVELRQALEPWHVLGEEGAPGGTARYVDSSLERLQVHATGLTEGRYELACNGVRIPLHRTDRRGEAIAGVRYRAWQPARSLHPRIPVHAPLTFDLVDTWSGRSVAGCRYHVAHPGGRNFEQFPVNAYEAEGRRLARFFPFGHTGGAMSLEDAAPDRDFPMTLDLRRFLPNRVGAKN